MINITILQEELEKALTSVYRFVASRPQLPILANILFAIEEGRVKLCATNLESGINYWLGAKIEGVGRTTVSAKTLLDVVTSLPKEKIKVIEKGGSINLSCSGTDITIPTTPANEFPNAEYKTNLTSQNRANTKSLAITPEIFSVIGKQVGFCASSDSEVKPEYTGILLIPTEKGFDAVATDGVRLSQKTFKSSLPFPSKTLLPAKIISEVPRTFISQNISVSTEENQVLFITEDIILASRTLDAEKFPNFAKIIPSSKSLQANMDREELERAIHLSSIFARDYVVKFEFSSSGCSISSENASSGEQKTTIAAKVDGDDLSVSFNWRFVSDFLSSIAGNEVEIRLTNATSPGVFTDPKDPEYLHLIMPIRAVTPEAE